MSRPKVVLWRPMYDRAGHGLLEAGGALVEVVDSTDPATVKAALGDARGLWVRTPERVTAEVLDAGRELVVVSTSGFGTDNIDIPAATERGILVVNHRGFGRIPVTEHTIMMILAAAKQLVRSDAAARDGSGWAERSGDAYFELDGKTVGILGLGFIGSELARKLRLGFRCRVLAFDPYADPRLAPLTEVEMMPTLAAMLREAEILCLVPELTKETRNIIGARELAQLPKGAIVVNTGRGAVLDLGALIAALDSGHLRAAALDVLFPEPPAPDHPILKHQKVILTPHTAGLTAETAARASQSAAEQILAALKGEMPRFPVNPEVWQQQRTRRPGGAPG
jgi:phosphoglycerate dehydrogenase-like enzyme